MTFTVSEREPATATAKASTRPAEEASHTQARRTHAPARETETTTESDGVKDRHAAFEWPEWVVAWVARASATTWAQQLPIGLGELWKQTCAAAKAQDALLLRSGVYLGGIVSWIACAAVYGATWPISALYGTGPLPALIDLMDAVREHAEDRAGAVVLGSISCVFVAACYGTAAAVQYMSLLVTLAGCAGIAYLTTLF
jgi:hypothetical protein